VSYTPDKGIMPKDDRLDNWQNDLAMKDISLTGPDFSKTISSGQNITDLIKDVQDIQAQGLATLQSQNNSGVPNAPSPGGFDPSKSFQNLSNALNPASPSLKAFGQDRPIGSESDFNRYKDAKNFNVFGYNPGLGSQQEYNYGNAMTWGDTIGSALGGFKHLAWNTFAEAWKGWGRMTESLYTWDSSKLYGSPEEREKISKEQEDIMNKYAIYDTAESKDGFFNRQFFGNMFQQAGFAVGAIAQFAMEEFLTAGVATLLEPALKGVMLGRVAKTAEEAAAIRKAAGVPE
jgi:hypothetical protein